MRTGTIVKLHTDKGYGFIFEQTGTTDIFFHVTDLVGMEFNEALEGRRVSFDIAETPKRPKAVNVRAAE